MQRRSVTRRTSVLRPRASASVSDVIVAIARSGRLELRSDLVDTQVSTALKMASVEHIARPVTTSPPDRWHVPLRGLPAATVKVGVQRSSMTMMPAF
jgi:hypothetical protein